MIDVHQGGTGIRARQSVERPRIRQIIPRIRVRKELRELLRMGVCAIALTVITHISTTSYGGMTPISSITWTLLILLLNLMGVSTFGSEFAHGTMSRLLSQPISRCRIWWEKILITGAVMASLPVCVLIARVFWPRERSLYYAWCVCWIALEAFCTGTWASLLLRQRFTAFFVSVLTPFFLLMIFNGILQFGEIPMDVIMVFWCGFALVMSYRTFLRLEV